MIKDNGLPAKVWVTTDRREALKGADYVIATFQVGGVDGVRGTTTRSRCKYGVDQCIGDTLGPGGIFRALRTIPVAGRHGQRHGGAVPERAAAQLRQPDGDGLLGARHDRQCQFVGLCHGVQTTLDLISGYVGVPKTEIDYLCAGINHMAWFLKLEHSGEDLYPTLRERFEQPEYYVNEKVRGEVLRHFGYFMTESTGHLSEYLPYFRKNQKALDLYCDEPAFGGETGAYYDWCKYVGEKYDGQDILADEPTALPARSIEYGSYIIEALETGRTFKLNGNVLNDGMISQPAGRLLRRRADLRRPHWACTRPSWATCRRSAPR